MYGLIGNFRAHPGKRDELVACMSSGGGGLPGCRSYIVATDPSDPDLVWITEVWDDAASHRASLELPVVRESIQRAMPLIAGFGQRIETVPVAGTGL